MLSSEFPLRWESTGDQWWYASPIDFEAANGLYAVVRELLHLDANLLIKLTSLRRIRRLETVWDDETDSCSQNLAKNRASVAKKLLHECETKRGHNSLIRAGYGGWLLYTAASAGDEIFVRELLGRDPFLVFGEGEYGVTDILYAGARSKSSELFRVLLEFAVSPKGVLALGNEGQLEGELDEKVEEFKWEMKNRAVHALARGGNLEMLEEVLGECSNVLVYRDSQGSSVLHSAAGRGQTAVVRALIASYDIITSRDNHGNTALHVAAYRGHLSVVEVLILGSPSLISLSNSNGDTYLHMAVAGFCSPGFRRLDRQLDLINQLLSGKTGNIHDIINVKNNDGRTALHIATLGNVQSKVVEHLMTVPSIDLNIQDADGMTPLDLLKRQPSSLSLEILIKELISAGGISSGQDCRKTSALVSRPKLQAIGKSPGTSFRISDAEIFLYTGLDTAPSCHAASPEISSSASELSGEADSTVSFDNKSGSFSHAARRLRFLLRWPRKKGKETTRADSGDDESFKSVSVCSNSPARPIPLRRRFAKSPYCPNKKAAMFMGNSPSPLAKRQFAAGLRHGVIQPTRNLNIPPRSPYSPPAPFSGSSTTSPPGLGEKLKGVVNPGPSCSTQSFDKIPAQVGYEQAPFNKKLMNHYFSFGAKHLGVEDTLSYRQPYLSHSRVGSLVA